ncbi:uroporphyrin-III C-methyltransferase [Lampropedia hyalina DSM 16112]|uniref:uroporphyrinogen-III C-methyltransferase n=1 Tax=Lampropedia hyalina DSM 16112 TaxID=1122156 RepID=A0A1M4U5Z6_9BURK|nr:uroporphyrinogen-III C-methyltransferase [Lampropedia hyalina]SHE52105.1 uroporphyrin-III C-methyltransferase [Lampropedia hyalina DSM 16112]
MTPFIPSLNTASGPVPTPSGSRQGSCTLVGAGPGDPELLTLKAVKAIAQASVLLVDDLVHPDVLNYASPTARIVHVGKRGGCKSTPQRFIEKLMVQAVQEGERVVRLKGGDPLFFGRSGEELASLRAAGIEAEVINGITSGLMAATSLGAPLTHRDHAHGVLFMTGHAAPGQQETDWGQLARTAHTAQLTLVIYMGMKCARHIQQGLLEGLPASTPVAVVQSVSLPTQRQALGTLGQLVDTLEAGQFASPAIIMVGDVLQASHMLQQCGDAPFHAHAIPQPPFPAQAVG